MSIKKNFFRIRPTNRSLSQKWHIEYYLHGERKRKYGNINSFDTVEERMKAAKRLIKKLSVKLGAVHKSEYQLMIEFLDNEALRKKWRKKTYQCQKSKIDTMWNWIKDNGGRKITEENIKGFFDWLQKNRHPITYNGYLTKIRSVLEAIKKDHYLDGIKKMKKAKSTPKRYFTSYQQKQLSQYIHDHDPLLYRCIEHYFYLGLRTKEMINLKAEHYLLDEQKIYVPGEVSKNGKHRYIIIPDRFFPRLDFIRYMRPDEYIFKSTRTGDRIGINTLANRMRKVLKEHGYSNEYSLYSWRHTSAVAFIRGGGTPKELQVHWDHHSLDQTDQYLRQMGIKELVNLKENFAKL